MSEEGEGTGTGEGTGEGEHVTPKPEWCDERFYNPESGEVRYEDIHKSWSHASETLSGKRLAPESYELQFSKDFEKEMLEGIDAEHPIVKSMMEIAQNADMTQENFDKVLNLWAGSEIAELQEADNLREQELASLGEHGPQRIKDMHMFLDANLDKEEAAGIKAVMNTAVSIEAIEKLIKGTKAPSLNVDDELTSDQVASHEQLKQEQFAIDDNGNRKMANPAYRKAWLERAAAANFKAA